MKTPYPVCVIHFITIVIIVDYVLNFVIIIINSRITGFQIHLFHIVMKCIGVIFCSFENVVVHCICTVLIFVDFAYNNFTGRFLFSLFFRSCCGHRNWWWNISRIKIDIISVGARYVTSSRTGAQQYCQDS